MADTPRAGGSQPAARPDERPHGRPDERGAAAVEFALVLPILLLLIFGIIGFGIVFAQNLAIGNAARDASRSAVVKDRTCAQVIAAARNAANTIGLSGSQVAVSVRRGQTSTGATTVCTGPTATQPCATSAAGDSVFVKITYTSRVPVPLFVIDNSFNLASTGVFQCEFS